MMKRVWINKCLMALVPLGLALLACSNDPTNTAGSSFETENIAFMVYNEDGSPAANARVLVRRMDYVAGIDKIDIEDDYAEGEESPIRATDSLKGIYNVVTDDSGRVVITGSKKHPIKHTNYIAEARVAKQKAITRFAVTEEALKAPVDVEVKLANAGAVSGKVYLPSGVRTATVGLQGVDYFVQTDTTGKFHFESLPEGAFNVMGFVHVIQSLDMGMGDGAELVERHQALGFTSAKVVSDEEMEGVIIGSEPVKDSDVPEYLFETFENGISSWYTTVARYASATLESSEAGEGRKGKVAHFKYSNDSLYNWALMGYAFPKMQDFSSLDSIVLWARGTATKDSAQWISVSMDVLVDSTSEYESGKAWAHVYINDEWKRYVVTPKSFQDSTDKNGGNLGWPAVNDHVTNFNIFGGGGSNEVWIDDIEFYGVKDFDKPL